MSVRMLVLALACLPMMGHASIQALATCQVKGDGATNEFRVFLDSNQLVNAENSIVTVLLVDSKSSLEKSAVKLTGVRSGEFLLAAGSVALPDLSLSRNSKPNIARVGLVLAMDASVAGGNSQLSKLIYEIDGQALTRQLICQYNR